VGYIDTATRYIDTSILFDLWQASLPEIFFFKPIRRLEPIERPAEEATFVWHFQTLYGVFLANFYDVCGV
jgi:hypothetical protein